MLIRSKLRSFLVRAALLMPLCGLVWGCNEPDNPKMAVATSPPESKPEEKELPKVGNNKVRDVGALPKYQRAFNKNQ